MKISFLIPAHNEEKIIGRTLFNLSKIPYKNYEVLIGLDGCTDKTEEIVKKFSDKNKKFKCFSLNSRKGKPEVIDFLIKKTSGSIIIINDADWLFAVNNKESMNKFISVFKDKTIGGIAESFPVEWDAEKLRNGNLTYKMVAYSSYFWLSYQKDKLAEAEGEFLYVKNPTMFLTNIFRKELYKKNTSLGDDFERSLDIFNKGYKIVIFPKENMPRMIASYNKIKFSDFFKQKVRTAIARKQLNESKRMQINIKNYYLPSIYYIFVNSWKKSFYIGLLMSCWILLTAIATLVAKFKSQDTKQGWLLRAKR